jgi:uncharacterized membrane protein
MINDLISIFAWWFLIFSLGIVFLPLTTFFFPKFFDKGYALSKIMGILLVSYLIWLFGSLKILPFTVVSGWGIVALLTVINLLISRYQKIHLKKIFKSYWKVFLFEEILFLLCLTLWSLIRGFQPNIQGLEKFMDFGFVNSILHSRFFPPADMWLVGKTINYYYFGHLLTAVLTKLSGLDSVTTYNLMIATIFGLSFTAAFSLGGNLVSFAKRKLIINHWSLVIIGGLLSAFLLTLGGNFHTLWWFLSHKFTFAGYWYPDATRFIVEQFGAADNTIHEFPVYSFVVADLHGHLINLPMVLFFVSLVFSLFVNKIFLIKNLKLGLIHLAFPGLILGVFYMTNAWDLPIYFLVFGLAIFCANYQKFGFKMKTFSRTLTLAISCLFMAIFFSLPFHLQFKSIASGIALTDFHSPLWMLLVLWGFPLILTLSFLLFLRKKVINHQSSTIDHFILILLFVSWFLIIIPEFFYIKDIYIHSYQRANTMFKFTYQSFVMFSVSSGYILFRILTGLKKRLLKVLYAMFFVLCSIFIFVYPYFAIRSYYGLKNYQSLNGINYLRHLYPDDYQGILWLKKNIQDQPVIVEAVGESYTDFARVSANTGLPTILGWRVHEWLWRGSFDEAGKRTEEVKEIYEGNDLSKTRQLLSQYQVQFIFVGSLERQTYSQLKEDKFLKLGKIVFSSGETKIHQINPLLH